MEDFGFSRLNMYIRDFYGSGEFFESDLKDVRDRHKGLDYDNTEQIFSQSGRMIHLAMWLRVVSEKSAEYLEFSGQYLAHIANSKEKLAKIEKSMEMGGNPMYELSRPIAGLMKTFANDNYKSAISTMIDLAIDEFDKSMKLRNSAKG